MRGGLSGKHGIGTRKHSFRHTGKFGRLHSGIIQNTSKQGNKKGCFIHWTYTEIGKRSFSHRKKRPEITRP